MTRPATNPHAHRMMPKPLRKGGLHEVETRPAGVFSIRQRAPVAYTMARADSNIALADTQPICHGTMRGAPYQCPELAPSGRPGAMVAKHLPSGGFHEQAARAAAAERERQRQQALPAEPPAEDPHQAAQAHSAAQAALRLATGQDRARQRAKAAAAARAAQATAQRAGQIVPLRAKKT